MPPVHVPLLYRLRIGATQGNAPAVIQKVKVTVVDGVTKTVRKPSNQDVMAELAERALHIFFPSEQIVREYVTQIITLADFPKIVAVEKRALRVSAKPHLAYRVIPALLGSLSPRLPIPFCKMRLLFAPTDSLIRLLPDFYDLATTFAPFTPKLKA